MAATPETVTNRLPGTLLLALWLALVAGLIEGGIRLFQVGVLHKVILMPIHVIWMAPVADLFWIGVPALVLLLLHRVLPRIFRSGFILGVLTALAFLPLILLYTGMAKIAALVLAAGLGYQAARMILAHPEGFGRMVRRTVVPLLIVVIAAGASIGMVRSLKERRALAGLGAAPAGAPNILLIIWDTARGQNLSVNGYERPTTPFLESFATQGTRFDLAMVSAPWTLPSHAAMFTGHRPQDVVTNVFNPVVDTLPTLAGALAAHGYATGGFVANMAFTTREHGLSRDFAHYDDYPISAGQILLASRIGKVLADQNSLRKLVGYWNELNRKQAAEVNRQFLRWVDHRDKRPFFAFLNYYDAHRPYISVEPYRSRFVADSSGRFHPRMEHLGFKVASKDEINWTRDNYDATLAYQDEQVRRLMDELQRRGLLENTLVIVSSDHGEHFGDHNRLGHMNSLYRQLLQVGLIMRLPGKVPAGQVVQVPVSLMDLPRTVLDLAGIPDTAGIRGTSMVRYWNRPAADSTARPEPVFSEIGTRKGTGPYSLLDQGYHYIAYQGNVRPAQLFNVADDPYEREDLIKRPELQPVVQGFQKLSVTYMGNRALEKDSPGRNDEEIVAPGQ
jgi:arylsulfatase A-like enzyme